ncbi:hypothetical protein GE21DRAFT_7928 [Neurospora crassa]|uniref:Uncharacterized protein n=2 Tax=Neurospora crassa TaxID=5141 RepID=Q1K746_NEUCR|nr:hypothetical protein NCU06690 [Neurospora crassa OR74A]EAA31769.1 hypothetical protein NCU06690 [Neurospora crassa OR74A]KHE86974.1 hypothetical protein GE21DRAFT_7928 [Neurospora crassa]CAD70915.1 hypothetical protein [Neurospora crassa]|eukprot:XP_961005.1 hypothetical protein NCU06690 [Neurospora crassa OR74A]
MAEWLGKLADNTQKGNTSSTVPGLALPKSTELNVRGAKCQPKYRANNRMRFGGCLPHIPAVPSPPPLSPDRSDSPGSRPVLWPIKRVGPWLAYEPGVAGMVLDQGTFRERPAQVRRGEANEHGAGRVS